MAALLGIAAIAGIFFRGGYTQGVQKLWNQWDSVTSIPLVEENRDYHLPLTKKPGSNWARTDYDSNYLGDHRKTNVPHPNPGNPADAEQVLIHPSFRYESHTFQPNVEFKTNLCLNAQRPSYMQDKYYTEVFMGPARPQLQLLQ